jgi:transcriptional regulator with XRE-family HTH domain
MVKKPAINMIMDRLAINNISKLKQLEDELEFEKASSLYLKLRKQAQEDSYYSDIRKHLKFLISKYEQEHWSDESSITEEQVKESDKAEALVRAENQFNHKRKEQIRRRLKDVGLNQTDLAKILGHRKGYMSELINGLRPFSKEDIVIINRLLKIRFEDLVPPFIKKDRADHVNKALESIPESKLRLTMRDLTPQAP